MFKKLREKISEEVQQTSLKLPASVQQITQQFTATTGGASGSASDQPYDADSTLKPLQTEGLVNISDIEPAGNNKNLFSIDEESSPVKTLSSHPLSQLEFVDLSSQRNLTEDLDKNFAGLSQSSSVEGLTFDPSYSNLAGDSPAALDGRDDLKRELAGRRPSSAARVRRDSLDSNASEMSTSSNLFRITEIPSTSFAIPQSDLESASEWEEGSMTAGMSERITKDMLFQAYSKMRQRYHKYKGRYADVVRAYREKEREVEKIRSVLTKTQDQAMRKVSDLREQCTLETQAKAHLEQELRSDLEEKDHKIETLLTKIRLLQEGYGAVKEGSFTNNNVDNGDNNGNTAKSDVPEAQDSAFSSRSDDGLGFLHPQ